MRLKSLLRRTTSALAKRRLTSLGLLRFQIALGELRKGEDVLRLTSGEKDILRLLAKAQGRGPFAR